jgi:hypothetical protein
LEISGKHRSCAEQAGQKCKGKNRESGDRH